MSPRDWPNDERLLDLLAARATEGLAPAEADELADCLRRYPNVDADELALAAAAADLALSGSGAEPLPADLRRQIEADGVAFVAARGSAPRPAARMADGGQGRRAEPRGVAGPIVLSWMLTAAAIVIATVGWWPRLAGPAPATPAPGPAELRSRLLAEASDVVRAEWAAGEAAYSGVTGDAVWSAARQSGFLRLRGLPANDPQQAQYQLWLVDAERDKHPVDGGVFDVGADGEVVVPIDAKLAVGRPQAFAITLEQPGGVVVSDGPLLVVAAVP